MRIGVDLGGTNIAVGVVDEDYRIAGRYTLPTKAQRSSGEVIADMAAAVRGAVQDAGVSLQDCSFVGIGSPGTCDERAGVVIYANNLHWQDVAVCREMERLLGVPCRVSNDANCAALGEVLDGAAKGCRNAVMLTLGTGVGGGIVLDGKLFSGGSSAGAELGHTMLIYGGEHCTCGRDGCLEAYASATALIRQARAAGARHPESMLAQHLEDMEAKTVFDCMAAGDAAAKAVFEQYVRYLAAGMADFVNIFRPEVFVLGGGVSNAGETLLAPLRRQVALQSYGGPDSPQPRIVRAALGNDAGIIGAAFLD